MKTSSNLAPTVLKSIFLATVLFWFFVILKDFDTDIIQFIFLSMIPISIVVFFTIVITIMPFIWFEKEDISKYTIFKKYFPYYSIVVFCICAFYIINSGFNIYVSGFFITAFITLMQSWVWLCKPSTNQNKLKNN